jgi:hypothetical protein
MQNGKIMSQVGARKMPWDLGIPFLRDQLIPVDVTRDTLLAKYLRESNRSITGTQQQHVKMRSHAHLEKMLQAHRIFPFQNHLPQVDGTGRIVLLVEVAVRPCGNQRDQTMEAATAGTGKPRKTAVPDKEGVTISHQ